MEFCPLMEKAAPPLPTAAAVLAVLLAQKPASGRHRHGGIARDFSS
jgi:hypothetical protein